jgi:DNA-binding transcriptional LysR family regulator
VLGARMAPLVSRHPDLELELIADPQHANLSRREADIAVRPSRFEQQEVVQREVAVVAFGLYASEGYLRVRGPPDFRSGCEGHALLEMTGMPRRTPETDWLASVARGARVVARANGRKALASMVAAGMGLGCLPRLLGDSAPGLQLLEPPGMAPQRQLWMGVHRDVRGIPRVRATLEFLAALFAQLRGALRP